MEWHIAAALSLVTVSTLRLVANKTGLLQHHRAFDDALELTDELHTSVPSSLENELLLRVSTKLSRQSAG